jgi:signal transduction histidine kinase
VLNAMFDRLQRSFEQARRFTADASHELRTPLTILRGEIEEALRSSRNNPEQEKILVSLLEQTGGLQKIAANLLLLAGFDAGKFPLDRAAVDFSGAVDQAVEDTEMLAAPARLRVDKEISASVVVEGDAVLLRRVLLNLTDNAVRYNRHGGEVRLTLRLETEAAVFSIGNTGPGIPAARHGELFQRFFRLDSDRNRASGGSGLGLSLCREIIGAHGGAITLARSDETWTEFVVRLPRATSVLLKAEGAELRV